MTADELLKYAKHARALLCFTLYFHRTCPRCNLEMVAVDGSSRHADTCDVGKFLARGVPTLDSEEAK